MKKTILQGICVLALLLNIQTPTLAETNVSFIYINGSNNNNEKMKNWFEEGVKKLHPEMKEQFETNEQVHQLMLSKNGVTIKDSPEIFFWGDKSKHDLDFVTEHLDMSKNFSPTVAYQVRSLITQFMHDAIWVQKTHHMLPIVKNLNEVVKNEYKNGYSTILYGYSAGTFITYEYLFNTLPYLNVQQLFSKVKFSEDMREFIQNNPVNDTCLMGLMEAKIGGVTSKGQLVFDPNPETFKQHYLALNEATEKACSPKGAIKGTVNFASPLVLFYSDLADNHYDLNYYNKLMLKYLMENGMFMMTVNFREDPLAFPTSRNMTFEEMEQRIGESFTDPTGFIYDNSGVWSWRPFFLAHTSYWSARKKFAKAVVKSFVEGYRFQYDPEFRKEILDKQ